jgi:hypothetical protein
MERREREGSLLANPTGELIVVGMIRACTQIKYYINMLA